MKIAKELPSYSVEGMKNDTLQVGIIGDSWANIHKTYEGNPKAKPLRWITIIMSGSSFYCIDDYRQELKERLKKAGLSGQVLVVDIAQLSGRQGFLSGDGVHPTANGFHQLDSLIVETIKGNENRIR